jgi:hypothetical protein
MNRPRFGALAAAAVLLCLAMVPSAPTLAAAGQCSLSVTPTSGPPGTRFTFHGSGFTPTQVRLTRDDHPPKVQQLELNGADPFSFSIVASDSDVGTWKAVATAEGAPCHGSATLHVVLPSTATADTIAQDRTPVMLAIGGLGILFAAVTFLMVRRSRRFGAAA